MFDLLRVFRTSRRQARLGRWLVACFCALGIVAGAIAVPAPSAGAAIDCGNRPSCDAGPDKPPPGPGQAPAVGGLVLSGRAKDSFTVGWINSQYATTFRVRRSVTGGATTTIYSPPSRARRPPSWMAGSRRTRSTATASRYPTATDRARDPRPSAGGPRTARDRWPTASRSN